MRKDPDLFVLQLIHDVINSNCCSIINIFIID